MDGLSKRMESRNSVGGKKGTGTAWAEKGSGGWYRRIPRTGCYLCKGPHYACDCPGGKSRQGKGPEENVWGEAPETQEKGQPSSSWTREERWPREPGGQAERAYLGYCRKGREIEAKTETKEKGRIWEEIEMVIDSGATDTVIGTEVLNGVAKKEGMACKKG